MMDGWCLLPGECCHHMQHCSMLRDLQVFPTSGQRSSSLWDVTSVEALQSWLDEYLDVGCTNEVFEVRLRHRSSASQLVMHLAHGSRLLKQDCCRSRRSLRTASQQSSPACAPLSG